MFLKYIFMLKPKQLFIILTSIYKQIGRNTDPVMAESESHPCSSLAGIITGSVTNWTFIGWSRLTCSPPSKSTGNTTGAVWRSCARVEQHPRNLYPTIDWLYASEMQSFRCCKRCHTRYWTPRTSILHDNFCLPIICSDNDVEIFGWYCLTCYVHMNLNHTNFVDYFSLCKKYWASNPCIVSFVD